MFNGRFAVKFKAVAAVLLKTVLPVVVGMALMVLVVAWMVGMFGEKIDPGREESAARRFDESKDGTYQVREVEKQYIAEAVGTLKSAQRTEISSRVMAPINRILVGAGQTVGEGDTLIELDRRAVETRLSQSQASLVASQAALQRAENDFKRAAELVKKKVIVRPRWTRARPICTLPRPTSILPNRR